MVLEEPPESWERPESKTEKRFTPHPKLKFKKLSDYGALQPPLSGECLDGVRFATKEQCQVQCRFKDCNEVEDDDGSRIYECDCGTVGKGSCVDGEYPGPWTCRNNCDGGKCKGSPGYQSVWCSGCANEEEVCEEGLYDDFDKCSDSCDGGFCTENAGEDGVRCACE
ncbi:hypothetical protein FDECE_13913 [Fusarium decemcellulare]|nr:hypothetical protein FDECE_13913 [Fusarium decemcellulare]